MELIFLRLVSSQYHLFTASIRGLPDFGIIIENRFRSKMKDL